MSKYRRKIMASKNEEETTVDLIYPFIRADARHWGHSDSYRDELIAEALRDGAPQNAVFKDHKENRWFTLDDYPEGSRIVQDLNKIVERLRSEAAQGGDEGEKPALETLFP